MARRPWEGRPREAIGAEEMSRRLSLLFLLAAAVGCGPTAVVAPPVGTVGGRSDPDRVRGLLADIRRRGFALCPGFIHPDATGIAVPVRAGGAVVAAISAVVPNDEHAYSRVAVLMATARGISRTLSPGFSMNENALSSPPDPLACWQPNQRGNGGSGEPSQ